MNRILVFFVLTLWPASAAADVAPTPMGLFTYNGWIIFGSVALGLILAGVVWKVSARGSEDVDSEDEDV